MGRLKYLLIGIGLVLLVAVLTKPSRETYEDNTRRAFSSIIKEQADKAGNRDMFSWLAEMTMETFFNKAIEKHLVVEDYILFNRAYLEVDEKRVTLATGVFGQTIFSSEIKDLLKK